MGFLSTIAKVLSRRKPVDTATTETSQLSRVLGAFDLTALGVGSTLGVGVYVLAGQVAQKTAGPAVILSFLVAAVASVFAGLCYAEFGARVPKAGSAYIYTYVCIGEGFAFVIGWNLILEYVIGSASVARGMSGYLDSLINNTMKDAFIDVAPIDVSFMAPYFDFFAFGICLVLAVALAFGMKESSMANNIITVINIGIVIFTIIVGAIKADPANWKVDPKTANTTDDIGDGGFFPFGVSGVIKGAATCFYGFIGFDCIATTGEEVRNPQKSIPISIMLSLFIIFLSYFGTSAVVTLMVPYYAQDVNVPIPHAFEVVGYDWAKWVVAIGGMFGLCASLFGAMFPLPRIIYAMASDSLIFSTLGRVSQRFGAPVIGTIISGFMTGLMAGLFDVNQLVNMMSIGTLMAYTIVAASVLLLRFTENRLHTGGAMDNPFNTHHAHYTGLDVCKQIFNCSRASSPSKLSESIATGLISIYCLMCLCISLCVLYLKTNITNGDIWAICLTAVAVGLAVLCIIFLSLQPKSSAVLSFKVPFIPLIPALSILINIYLMMTLDSMTWIRFGVWMAIGLSVYGLYGLPNSYRNYRDYERLD